MGNSSSRKSKSNTSASSDEKKEVKDKDKDKDKNDEKGDLFEWTKDTKITQRLDFEKWYPIVSDHTMKSEIIDCNEDEISAMLKAYEFNRYSDSSDIYAKLDQNTQKILKDLTAKIDDFISRNNYQESGIFIRFSNRSPKDAVLKMGKKEFESNVRNNAIKIYQNSKKNIQGTKNWSDNGRIVNSIMRSLVLQTSYDLCVYNGSKAIELIIRSDRIYTDFKMGQLLKGNENYKSKLILRRFEHLIDFESEFRVFVYKGNITGISQYNYFSCLTKILDNKELIVDKIELFFKDKIHPKMKENDITSYVMDVGLMHANINSKDSNNSDSKQTGDADLDEKEKDQEKEKQMEVKTQESENNNDNDDDNNKLGDLILIEINPFVTRAGALLFDWQKDVKLLTKEKDTAKEAQNGNNKENQEITPDVRIVEIPSEKKPDKFTSHLDALFDQLYKEMQDM